MCMKMIVSFRNVGRWRFGTLGISECEWRARTSITTIILLSRNNLLDINSSFEAPNNKKKQ